MFDASGQSIHWQHPRMGLSRYPRTGHSNEGRPGVPRGSYTSAMRSEESRPAVGLRSRGFIGVEGPGAEDYLQRMVSNDVAALGAGEACDALLLTPKARVIAPLTVVRRTEQDFLLLTEPELAEIVRSHLLAFRFAARLDVELEEHESFLLLGGAPPGGAALFVGTTEYGEPAFEVLDVAPADDLPRISEEELERLRIEAGTPRFGREIDDRVLPAEAGLVERAVSLTKGCYPGQEPIARLHYRGHANRGLRVLVSRRMCLSRRTPRSGWATRSSAG